ncbi:MAG TPA: AsmA family protein [Steroidobacteraceae bacterium]|nr:AsmA family protein [Steroidobacteraceae bacterium]
MKLTPTPRWLKWLLIALAGLILLSLALVIGTAALVDAGYFHEPIRKLIVAKAHREIRVLGPVKAHLLSLHPSMTAEGIVIHNPPWMPAGILAEIGRASFALETPTLAEPLRFRRLELQSATFNLLRDESGKANWRSTSGRTSRKGPPLMGGLSVPDAQVHLRDARRHLIFDGKVSAMGAGVDSLRIDGTGVLNTRPVTLSLVADPLATARRNQAYRFRFEERSSGSTLSGQGALASPFDVRELQTTLEAHGEDMKDLRFLIGLNFPDTGPYRASGEMQRSGLQFTFTNVRGLTGESDIAGTVHVDSTASRTQLTADLHSDKLRRMDLGKKAAKRASERKKDQPLFPRTPIEMSALRRTDSTVVYRIREVDMGKLKLNTLVAHVKVDHGVLTAAPVSAKFADGSATGQWRFDGSKDLLATQLALDFNGLQLSQFGHRKKGEPPLDGPLRARLRLKGKGHSVHELAASADGTIVAILPQGEIRAALAEAVGFDLRGLGLKMSGKQPMAPVRCGIAAFDAHDGVLTSKTLVLDTERVLMTGTGTVDLNDEALDFQFRGHPKHAGLRLRSSLVVHGTLAQPVVGFKSGNSKVQAGAGIALGVLLTPLAAIAAFIDPGRAQDADCAALIRESAPTAPKIASGHQGIIAPG